MGLQDEETNGHRTVGLAQLGMVPAEQLGQRDEVSQGFPHLLAVDGNHIVVHPVMDPLRTAGSHVLGDFAFVVREHQVHSAPMDVEGFAQVLGAHHRALQVPAGEAVAPGTGPAHDMLGLGLFPQGEVVRGVFVTLSVQAAGPFQGGLQRTSGQHSVIVVPVVFLHVEIHRPVALVGVTGRQDGLDHLDLFDDMAGCPRFDGRRFRIQEAHRLVVALGIILHHFHGLQLLQAGFLGNLVLPFVRIVLQMAHIGDIAHITHLVAQVFQETEQDIVGNAGTGMAQVGVAIHGGAADIHPHMSFVDGFEQFLVPGKGIGQV